MSTETAGTETALGILLTPVAAEKVGSLTCAYVSQSSPVAALVFATNSILTIEPSTGIALLNLVR
jgi:hypothetical protein